MSNLKKLPTWLIVSPDSALVVLSKPYEINGVQVDRLTLRAPTVRDVRAANAMGGGDEEQREMNLFASLSESGLKDLEGLKLTDYQRLQAAYFRLVQDDGV
ncbi:Phage tail assembly chaperone protein, E, or 41 or 14 [Pseudomonas sp. ok272]|uniref:phage tail assembly protein n=1 Tax=unclassified Pseudomonas TaxID=196821 RepID=UPI0008CA58FA|nr:MULTISPECIES: phage tail assembly protein [unclassified Pseudomonas]SEN18714.1 Phage tail assembly chaperone protein, E, or 41 or 14 [Pseudomonas sp. ok272]SFN10643.1 Phage tail assembly chaperone protein, E, or 41 or 14 [Pseudomonas sp. ok602]